MDDGSRLLYAVVLLFCAAFFAMSETAISSVSRTRIKLASERGDTRADKALYVLDNFDNAISTILICINIAQIGTASVVTLSVTSKWGMGAVPVSTLITTLALFFFGEMLPKSIARSRSEQFTLSCSGILAALMKVLKPFAEFLAAIGRKATEHISGDNPVSVTEDELYDIIEDMTEEGTLNEEQGDLISSALQFGDVTVENVLTPRVDIAAIDIDDSLDEVLSTVKETTHSRLPVYEGSIDNIIGILQIRTFIKAYVRQGDSLSLRPLLDEPMFVHQSANIDELLPTMSKKRMNMAVVTDNYGGTLGIVTVEDILEELVGEIWDEDDVVEENVIVLGENVWRVDAEESVSDFFEFIDFEDPEENEELVNTLMGEWAYEQFTGIPRAGDSFSYHNLSVSIALIQHNRILKLRVVRTPEAEEGGAE